MKSDKIITRRYSVRTPAAESTSQGTSYLVHARTRIFFLIVCQDISCRRVLKAVHCSDNTRRYHTCNTNAGSL